MAYRRGRIRRNRANTFGGRFKDKSKESLRVYVFKGSNGVIYKKVARNMRRALGLLKKRGVRVRLKYLRSY